MLKDLLEKFDKEFDEQFVDESGVNDRSPDDIKSLAHSHLEAAYEAGKNENTRCAGCDKCLSRPGIITGEMCVAKYDCDCHHPFSQQSNLERLIEKCGDRFTNLALVKRKYIGYGKYEELGNLWVCNWTTNGANDLEDDWEVSGSTPTEAVENLIKALEKK